MGDHEREEIEPDNVSEVDYGGSEDEDEDPGRIVDDDEDGSTRPLSEYAVREAMAIMDNIYEAFAENNRCWRCGTVFFRRVRTSAASVRPH